MSKSLDNAILLRDDADTVTKRIMSMYTDPKRIHATDPGTVENNPLWVFHDIFNPDKHGLKKLKRDIVPAPLGMWPAKKN